MPNIFWCLIVVILSALVIFDVLDGRKITKSTWFRILMFFVGATLLIMLGNLINGVYT